jgi:hypothetical protein
MMRYKVIWSGDKASLEDEVTHSITQGWYPTGGICVDSDGVFYQAMTYQGG